MCVCVCIYIYILSCESAVCTYIYCDISKEIKYIIYIYIALLTSSFICKPNYSAKGQEHVAYTKIHTCVRVYLVDYVLNIRSTN